MALIGNQPLPGLHPVGNGVGGTSPRIREYVVNSTYAGTIGEGCIMVKDALGANLATEDGTANLTLASVLGVAAHGLPTLPGDDAKVTIYDDPQQEFVCPMDATMTTTTAIEAIGQFVGITEEGNLNNTTLGQGNVLLRTASLTSAYTNTIYLQVVGIVQDVGDTLASQTTNGVTYFGALRVKITDGMHTFGSHGVGRITA